MGVGAERPKTWGGSSQKLGRINRVWGGRGADRPGADRLWGGSTGTLCGEIVSREEWLAMTGRMQMMPWGNDWLFCLDDELKGVRRAIWPQEWTPVDARDELASKLACFLFTQLKPKHQGFKANAPHLN